MLDPAANSFDGIQIVEVGPRDGLQNEDVVLGINSKVELIEALIRSGITRLEAASFAHPKRVPQMADAEAVMSSLGEQDGVSLIGLVMNWRGWERASGTGVAEINFNIGATDSFNTENQGVSTFKSVEVLGRVAKAATDQGLPITATVGVAWGCPFEGETSLNRLESVLDAVAETDVTELALADTIGVADPWTVAERFELAKSIAGDTPLRGHFHNTRNTGLANAYAAIQTGVRTLDASVGGLGGCPFAPKATGNIPTEDLIYMLHRAGLRTGIDLDALIVASGVASDALGKELPAMLPKAGTFP